MPEKRPLTYKDLGDFVDFIGLLLGSDQRIRARERGRPKKIPAGCRKELEGLIYEVHDTLIEAKNQIDEKKKQL